MPYTGWLVGAMLIYVYYICLFSIGVTAFDKDRRVLATIGFILPIVWLFGALLPAREGSRYELNRIIQGSGKLTQRNSVWANDSITPLRSDLVVR
jgi:hypothetical protein